MDGDDARMTQPRQHSTFASEALGEARRGCEPLRQDLQRHESIELRLPCLEDDAHAALADLFNDLQIRESHRDVHQLRQIRRREWQRALICR